MLLTHIIEHAIGEGHGAVDFLRGDHRYKEELATGERETVYLTVLRRRPGAAVYFTRKLLLPSVKARIGKIEPRDLWRTVVSRVRGKVSS